MNRLTCFVAVLAVGSVGFLGCNKDESTTTPPGSQTPGEKIGGAVQRGVDSTTQTATNAGKATTQAVNDAATGAKAMIAPSGSDDLTGVRSAVEGVVTNALDRNNWADMLDHFTKADRDRLTAGKPDSADLDAVITQVKQAWRDKYSDAFGVMAADKVYNPQFMALSGNSTVAGDAQMRTATATIPASHGLPELKLTAVSEGGKWRLDVPDTLDAKGLHDNLLAALKDIQGGTANWPADKTQAYQHVTHRLLMAVVKGS